MATEELQGSLDQEQIISVARAVGPLLNIHRHTSAPRERGARLQSGSVASQLLDSQMSDTQDVSRDKSALN